MNAVFLDLDRTLFDQDYAADQGALGLREEFSDVLSLPEDEFVRWWRQLNEKHYARYLEESGITFQEQQRARIREAFQAPEMSDPEAERRFQVYYRRYQNNWRLYDDVIPCLDALGGVPLGIISNGDYEAQKKKLKKTGIRERFTVVAISSRIGHWKPKREIFQKACEMGGYQPQECVYVGDNLEEDAVASKAAGMYGVWLNRKNQDKDGRVPVIHSLAELPAILKKYALSPRRS